MMSTHTVRGKRIWLGRWLTTLPHNAEAKKLKSPDLVRKMTGHPSSYVGAKKLKSLDLVRKMTGHPSSYAGAKKLKSLQKPISAPDRNWSTPLLEDHLASVLKTIYLTELTGPAWKTYPELYIKCKYRCRRFSIATAWPRPCIEI